MAVGFNAMAATFHRISKVETAMGRAGKTLQSALAEEQNPTVRVPSFAKHR